MSTIIHSSKFEDDTSPLVSLEDVHMELTGFKQEEPSPTTDQPLLVYTSAPIHPLLEGASLNSATSSWENEHLRRSRRNSEGSSSQSHLRSQVPVYQSSTHTEDQSLHATATPPPRHAQYERIPFGRMIGRRHHLMLRRGDKGQSEWPNLIGGSAKVQKYQKVVDDRAPECEEEEQEQEREQEVEEEVSSEKQRKVDRVSVLKTRRSWSGSLTSAFTFAPYQSF